MAKTGVLAWHGRKLSCNGVTVAQIIDIDHAGRLFKVGMWGVSSEKFMKEESARRAINRKFCLPDDFGAFKTRRPPSAEIIVAMAETTDLCAAGGELL
jgi:hypothetical protein